MESPHAEPGEVIDIRPPSSALTQAKATTLVKTRTLEIIRLVIPSRNDISHHKVHEEITVECLEGRVAFAVGNTTKGLEEGQVYLANEEPHSPRGIDDASGPVTILLR